MKPLPVAAPSADRPAAAVEDLDRLLRLWLIDKATSEVLRQVRPLIGRALAGLEVELQAAIAIETVDDNGQTLSAERGRREAESLARFWRTILSSDLDEAKIRHATELGRQQFRMGLSARHFLLASQSVLRRLLDALMEVDARDRARAIDGVTRLVLCADDLALAAYYDSLTDRVSELEVDKRTADLRAQMRVLEDLAHVDGLTKLFNRRHFDQALAAELDRAERQKTPLCLLLADLDHFKRVNDAFGHQRGDAVLVHVATVLHGTARRSDVLARYGGEEFALILPTTTRDRAQIAAERLRRAVERKPLDDGNGPPISLTLSIGIAVATGAETAEALVKLADAALYRAKAAGRNRVA